MSRTIKSALAAIAQRVKIASLKNKIKRMERSSYLNLYERMELRDAASLLNSLEQQQGFHNTTMLSLQ